MESIIPAAVVAAIISGGVALFMAQKRISVENITRERRDWRDKVRDKAIEVHDALIQKDKQALDRLRNEFRTVLNPTDPEDQKILDCIEVAANDKELERAEEFATRVAFLLKHDWERAKLEAGPAVRRWCSSKPERLTYEEAR